MTDMLELLSSVIRHPSGVNMPSDSRVITTSPYGALSEPSFSPFDLDAPDDLVFCCFFRTMDDRAAFLEGLREIARAAAPAPGTETDLYADLAESYDRQWSDGRQDEAVLTASRWWVTVKRHLYHAYSLKIGSGPYRTSCIVAFEEQEPDDLRYHIDRAVEILEESRSRVLDFFGIEGMG